MNDNVKIFNEYMGDGDPKRQICIETFPRAVVCTTADKVVSAKRTSKVRRKFLRDIGYDHSGLPNIDFVDAALCAVAADEFQKGNYQVYGDCAEGFIVVPAHNVG